MQTLLFTLQDHDNGHLKIIADFWGLDLPSKSSLEVAKWLADSMLVEEAILEMIESLPKTTRTTLDDLLQQGGRAPYADMARRYGHIREMGAGRRDRIKPWRNPISPLEVLWYRGLIARAFADTSSGPREFVFIPSDLLPYFPPPISAADRPGEEVDTPKQIDPGTLATVEDATTLLAFLRRKPIKSRVLKRDDRDSLLPFLHQPTSIDLIMNLLTEIGLLTSKPIQPQPEATRNLLEISKENGAAKLLLAWRDSAHWNDLLWVGGIHFSGGKWPNDPLASRYAVLNFLRLIPIGKWWGLDSFIEAIHEQYPSYLRPAGDFDSWYLQDEKTGNFLRGFEHWERIDGALIRHIITEPLHLLGATDLGAKGPDQVVSAFRLTPFSRVLFEPDFQCEHRENISPISVFLDGTILAPITSRQSHRYQIARFCDWLDLTPSGYRYRISPSALREATEQGLSLGHVQSILERSSENPLPPSLLEALTRWESKGQEAYIERAVVLRVKESQVLDQLQSNYATARFLQERLGPTTAAVQEKDLEKLYSEAVRLGILIDPLQNE